MLLSDWATDGGVARFFLSSRHRRTLTTDSSQLTHEQARRIHDAIGPTVGYLSRLLDRMDKRHFPPDDKLRRLATDAFHALKDLAMDTHYRSCRSGVG